jgi:hypothetical protein
VRSEATAWQTGVPLEEEQAGSLARDSIRGEEAEESVVHAAGPGVDRARLGMLIERWLPGALEDGICALRVPGLADATRFSYQMWTDANRYLYNSGSLLNARTVSGATEQGNATFGEPTASP